MGIMQRVILATLGLMVIAGATGCAAAGARWQAFLQCRAERRLLAQQMALEEIRAMKEAIHAEDRAILAEHELELARMQTDAEKRACLLRSQYDESVRTKLGMDFDQRIQVGQLQVNMDEMRRLMEERERDYREQMRRYEDELARQQATQTRAQNQPGPSCMCAVPVCGVPEPGCDAPHSPHCCQKCGMPIHMRPQLAADCAGVRPFSEAPQKPLRQPITAMEIPLMLPVKLELGVTNSYLTESQVRRLPYREAPVLPQKAPCGHCPACKCGKPCPQCAPPPACEMPVTPVPAPPSEASNDIRSSEEKVGTYFASITNLFED